MERVISSFKQLSSLQIIAELMTSSNHINQIQLAKLFSFCFDLRNIQLPNRINITSLLCHNII